MPNPNSQAEAGAGSEGTTDATKVEAGDSLNNPGKEQTFGERVNSASSRADIMRLTAEAMEGRAAAPAAEVKTPAADTNGAPANAEGEGEIKTVEGDGAAAAEGSTEAKPAEGGEQSEEEKAAAEAQAKAAADAADKAKGEEEDKLPDRIRLTNFSKVEKLALQLKRENPKLTLAEAEVKAKDALGIVEDGSAAKEPADSGLPKTAAEADAKLKELVAKRTKAFKEDLDFTEGDRLTNEIEALREHKLTLREQASQQASNAQKEYDAAFEAAEKKASGLYDFVKQPDSAGFKRIAEIDRQLEENKDPLFNDPNKALVIAQMVAKELQIAPKSPTAKAAATTAAKVTVKPAVTPDTSKKTVPPVASGASRTTTASTQGDGFAQKIAALKTPADIENFLAGTTKF